MVQFGLYEGNSPKDMYKDHSGRYDYASVVIRIHSLVVRANRMQPAPAPPACYPAAQPSPAPPYQCLVTPVAEAPKVADWYGERQLVFARDLPAGAIVFTERPLVESMLFNTPQTKAYYLAKYNDRYAWSMVEKLLKPANASAKAYILSTGYAANQALVAQSWQPEDDHVLNRLCKTYKQSPEAVRELYTIVATNNVVSQITETKPLPNLIVHEHASYGFFPLLSYCNHACKPSIRLEPVVLTPGGGEMFPMVTVRTFHAVKAGEPVTFDYALDDPTQPLPKTKRVWIKEQFGFDCSCVHCVKADIK